MLIKYGSHFKMYLHVNHDIVHFKHMQFYLSIILQYSWGKTEECLRRMRYIQTPCMCAVIRSRKKEWGTSIYCRIPFM